MWGDAGNIGSTIAPIYIVLGVAVSIMFAAAFAALAANRGRGRPDSEDD